MQEIRGEIRERAHLLITNPDMLHCSVLPVHRQFGRFLANLRYVVVDEGHAYRHFFAFSIWHCSFYFYLLVLVNGGCLVIRDVLKALAPLYVSYSNNTDMKHLKRLPTGAYSAAMPRWCCAGCGASAYGSTAVPRSSLSPAPPLPTPRSTSSSSLVCSTCRAFPHSPSPQAPALQSNRPGTILQALQLKGSQRCI